LVNLEQEPAYIGGCHGGAAALVAEGRVRPFSSDDVGAMRRHGVHIVLVGEALMRAGDPGSTLVRVFGLTEPLFNKSY